MALFNDDDRGRRRASTLCRTICLISTLFTIGVVAENCGDPLASCYVGNAKAGEGALTQVLISLTHHIYM